ncbi:hypothetical protein PSU4_25990 [Pseudonocardia sulfidoxydans NBRC 16205]|uniref:Uncharacterized protein n=1 Tax=Pseudonocardia sulfidoxydans NBRC 16205 TaxID=1223511 RepID=A0A511DFS6_9PSEU|nr:hypothetical protein PSU4_25990 [Pseudonocardia sulfidoxydans NBRC 16205]
MARPVVQQIHRVAVDDLHRCMCDAAPFGVGEQLTHVRRVWREGQSSGTVELSVQEHERCSGGRCEIRGPVQGDAGRRGLVDTDDDRAGSVFVGHLGLHDDAYFGTPQPRPDGRAPPEDLGGFGRGRRSPSAVPAHSFFDTEPRVRAGPVGVSSPWR